MKAAQASYSKRVKILPELRHILTSKRSKILFQEKTEINALYESIYIYEFIYYYCTTLTIQKEKEKEGKKFIWGHYGSRWLWTEQVNYLHNVHHLAYYSISSHYIQILSHIFHPADSSCSSAVCLELWNSSEVCRVAPWIVIFTLEFSS